MKFLQSSLKRLKSFNVKTFMAIGRRNRDFMNYFPDIFLKKDPPREFFWKIFAKLYPDDYQREYNSNLQRIRQRIAKPQTIKLDPEQRRIMAIAKSDNIQLQLALSRPGVTRNIIYLRKTRGSPVTRGPIDRYLNRNVSNNDQIYHDEQE